MNNDTYTPCTKCGRPQTICKGDCCRPKRKACICPREPGCPHDAIIPVVVKPTMADIKGLTNCFVQVAANNNTLYLDDRGAPIITWAGPVEFYVSPDWTPDDWNEHVIGNKEGLRGQFAYYHWDDNGWGKIEAFYYDQTGKPYWAGEFEEIIGE